MNERMNEWVYRIVSVVAGNDSQLHQTSKGQGFKSLRDHPPCHLAGPGFDPLAQLVRAFD